MGKTADFFADEDVPRARVALLLEHFSRLEDDREPWRIVYPLSEVLLLLTCATIASCDDFDEIAAFGHHHLDLLRKFAPYYNGIPCERWLRALVNRIDPETFASCFEDWIRAVAPAAASSSPSTARLRVALTTSERASKRCTRSAPTRPTPISRWRKSACRRRPTRSRPFPSCSIIWPRGNNSKAPSSPSTPWGVRSKSPPRSSNTRPIFCCR